MKDKKIKLECISYATGMATASSSPEQIIEIAKLIYAFVGSCNYEQVKPFHGQVFDSSKGFQEL